MSLFDMSPSNNNSNDFDSLFNEIALEGLSGEQEATLATPGDNGDVLKELMDCLNNAPLNDVLPDVFMEGDDDDKVQMVDPKKVEMHSPPREVQESVGIDSWNLGNNIVQVVDPENPNKVIKFEFIIKEEPKALEIPPPMEQVEQVEEEEKVCEYEEWVPTPTTRGTKKRPMRPRSAAGKRIIGELSTKTKKKKLYQLGEFDDPEQERQRQNAINAKLNREKKKREKEALMTQMDVLRKEVQRLKAAEKEAIRFKGEASRLKEENKRLKRQIANMKK